MPAGFGVAVTVAWSPKQILDVFTLTVGFGFTGTLTVVVPIQPAVLTTVNVYTPPAVETVTVGFCVVLFAVNVTPTGPAHV